MAARSANSSNLSNSCSTSVCAVVSARFIVSKRKMSLMTNVADYAGNAALFAQTCSGSCYNTWVAGSPSNYDTAYFEVQHVRTYGIPGELTIISSGGYRSAEIAGMLMVLMSTAVAFLLAL